MKRTGRCRDMHDVQCGDSPGYLARRIQRMSESGSMRRNKTTGSGRECRVRSQGYTISIHDKRSTARKGSKAGSHVQISCARSPREDEGYLQIVTNKSTDPVVRSDTTDGDARRRLWVQQRHDGQAAISGQAQEIRCTPE